MEKAQATEFLSVKPSKINCKNALYLFSFFYFHQTLTTITTASTDYIIATTNIINGKSLIESTYEPMDHFIQVKNS